MTDISNPSSSVPQPFLISDRLLLSRHPAAEAIGHVDLASVVSHQRSMLSGMKATFDIAMEQLYRMDPFELADRRISVLSELHYGFPDRPALTSPRPIICPIDDYALTLPLGSRARRGTIEHIFFRDRQRPRHSRQMAIYPNYLKFLIHWIERVDAPIHRVRIAVQKLEAANRPSGLYVPPTVAANFAYDA